MENAQSEPLSFEKVWAMFQESDRKFQAMSQETREQFQAMSLEAREHLKETEKLVKENSRQMGLLHNSFGDLAEHLVAPGIIEKFNKLGFNFPRQAENFKFRDPENPGRLLAEVDIYLENGDFVIAVEVKSKPKEADVDKHVKRMEVLRQYADRRGDTRKYCGAVAGAIINQALRGYILRNGFYVIEQSGDTVKLTIPDGFTPREW